MFSQIPLLVLNLSDLDERVFRGRDDRACAAAALRAACFIPLHILDSTRLEQMVDETVLMKDYTNYVALEIAVERCAVSLSS